MIERDDARPNSVVAAIGYAQRKVMRYLRVSSPKVDLVEFGAGQPLPPGAVSRVTYRFDADDRSSP
jgi:hypothetical protein